MGDSHTSACRELACEVREEVTGGARCKGKSCESGLYRSVARVAEGAAPPPTPIVQLLWPSLEAKPSHVGFPVGGCQETMEAECRKEQALLGVPTFALTWQGPLEAAAVG